jgi:hypothetical protein
MGASCDLTGETEKETLVNQKKWLCSWTKNIIEQFDSFYNSVKIVSDGISQYDSKLAPIKVLLNGALRNIQNEFTDDEENILDAIKKTLVGFKDECNGDRSLTVYPCYIFNEYDQLGIKYSEINDTVKILTINGDYNYFRNKNAQSCFHEVTDYLEYLPDDIEKCVVIFNFNSDKEMNSFKNKMVDDSTKMFIISDENNIKNYVKKIPILQAICDKFPDKEIEFYYQPRTFKKVDSFVNISTEKATLD